MEGLRRQLFDQHRGLWLIAGIGSVILFALVLSQVDFSAAVTILEQAQWRMVALVVALFISEGIITAWRIQQCATGSPTFLAALRTNAWYVLGLTFLPARLGEIAAIWFFEAHLNQSKGAATASIVVQRLLDVLILSTFFLIAASFIAITVGPFAYWTAASLITCALLAVYNLEFLVTVTANLLVALKLRWLKSLVRLLLQARRWIKQHHWPSLFPRLILLTILKWALNLTSIVAILVLAGVNITWVQMLLTSTLYNFLAVIPLQTIGGFGIGEVGLAGMLVFLGLDLGHAAAIAILARLIIISSPLMYFALVAIVSRLFSETTQANG